MAELSCSYHDAVSFRRILARIRCQQNLVSIFCLNAQSLRNKYVEVSLYMEELKYNFDVLAFTETWFSNKNDVVQFDHYRSESIFRRSKRGGGLALYIADGISYRVITEYTVITDDYECLAVAGKAFTVAVIYRPPSRPLSVFLQFLERLSEYLLSLNLQVAIVGDFNINMLVSDAASTDLLELISSVGLTNVIDVATRVTNTSHSLIDLCLTRSLDGCMCAGVLSAGISDHMPVFCFLPGANACQSAVEKVFRRFINERSCGMFRQTLSTLTWANVLNTANPNEAYDLFLEVFTEAYDCVFPLIEQKQFRKARKPWVTRELLKKMKFRDRLFHEFIKTKDIGKLLKYKKLRNNLTTELKKARSLYYMNKFSAAYDKPQQTWTLLRSLVSRNKVTVPDEIIADGCSYSGTSLADKFNSYFLMSGESLLPRSSFKAYIKDKVPTSIFLAPTSPYEVESIIKKMKNTCASGFDDINVRPVKETADIISIPLTHICNAILSSGIFPEKMKIARVCAVHKGGAWDVLGNYRPISVLTVFSKIIEQIINNRFSSFFTVNNVIANEQYGFQKGKSVENALLDIKEKLITNIENHSYTLGIFLDFKKAFDSVKHDILFNKLELYGIRGIALDLVKSYLLNRRQFVTINNFKSTSEIIRYGVPQGSILGPLLFLAYINDIVLVPETPNIVLYADDTNVFFHGTNPEIVVRKANMWLKELHLWLLTNDIALNTDKTKYILFRSCNKPMIPNVVLSIAGKKIERVTSVKFLGVTFNEHLSWTQHINNLRISLSKTIGMLNRFRNFLPRWFKCQLYYALMYSRLCYCILVWGTTTKGNFDRICILQKKFVRFIENLKWDDHTLPYFYKNNLLKIENIYLQRLAFKIFHDGKPDPVVYINKFKREKCRYDLRHEPYLTKRVRTSYGKQTLGFQIPHFLNNYPGITKVFQSSPSIGLLKKEVKLFFLRK